MQPVSHGAAGWHPDGPAEFNGLDILSDQTSIFGSHRFEPSAHWLVARLGAKKTQRERAFGVPSLVYHAWYFWRRQLLGS
jgi:hypothetical protein